MKRRSDDELRLGISNDTYFAGGIKKLALLFKMVILNIITKLPKCNTWAARDT